MAKQRKTSAKTASLQDRIIDSIIADVPFDGWTDSLFGRAAQKLKMPEADVRKAVGGTVTGLIGAFSGWADTAAREQLKKSIKADMRVRDKVALGVRTRLEFLRPHREAASLALKYMAVPPRGLRLPGLVWKTADMIWQMAGDTATDYNRYTKRFLLSGVLSATALYWMNDDSRDNARTWAFLDDRIDDALKLGKAASRFKRTDKKAARS